MLGLGDEDASTPAAQLSFVCGRAAVAFDTIWVAPKTAHPKSSCKIKRCVQCFENFVAREMIRKVLMAVIPLIIVSVAYGADTETQEDFEPIKAGNIIKANVVLGVPNIARLGGSYHRILKMQGRLMYTLGVGGNIGSAVGDTGAVGQKFSVQESYGNIGVLPGIHLLASDRSILLGLNAVIGCQYSSVEIGNPKYLSPNENRNYQITSDVRKEFSFHAGIEAGIYYFANPMFVGVDFGFVATPNMSIPYAINENNLSTTYNYNMPTIRYSGIRISVTAGYMF
ncbi:hypothetical protein [Turneriella parva]|uniref:hypothetical protein n=1 Tax=Turneriella parva TaxID=29510 RepID=UPI0002E8194E|nr:hypothetical protein [Turneriella parva]